MKVIISHLFIILTILFYCCSDISDSNESSENIGKIYGYVYDSISNEPVPDTRIVIPQSDKITYSDSSGYFEFDNLDHGYYSVFAIKDNYSRDSLYIHLKSNSQILVNLSISFEGLYALTDSLRYYLLNQQDTINVKIINNAMYTHYLWIWCDVMYILYKYNGTSWEIYHVPPCTHDTAPQLFPLATKDSTIIQYYISETGMYYFTFQYRIYENDQDRLLFSNIFEVIRE